MNDIKKKIIAILKISLLLITLMFLALTYHFSDRPANESRQDSTKVLVMLRLVTEEDVANNTAHYQKLHSMIRVFAHFLIYGLLTLSLSLLLFVITRKIMLSTMVTFMAALTWAILDEKHQILVEGRAFEWFDIYVDALGILFTLTIVTSVHFIHRIMAKKA